MHDAIGGIHNHPSQKMHTHTFVESPHILSEGALDSCIQGLHKVVAEGKCIELGLLVTLEDENLPFTCVEGDKLAIAFWCIPQVYMACQRYFFHGSKEESVTPLMACTVSLLINAENYSYWNFRKTQILEASLSTSRELAFLDLIFSKHPKSGEAWNHRRWVLAQHTLSPTGLQHELDIALKAAERYPRNYYAWTFRRYLSSHANFQFPHAHLAELQQLQTFVRRHVGDYSVCHYRQQLLLDFGRKMGGCGCNAAGSGPCLVGAVWEAEMQLSQDILTRFPGHASQWHHRRQCVTALMQASWMQQHCFGCLASLLHNECQTQSWMLPLQQYSPEEAERVQRYQQILSRVTLSLPSPSPSKSQ